MPPSANFLALGDSYTIGEGVAPADRWPNKLAARLGLGEPQIIAKTGWTTDELSAAIDVAAPMGPFALVTLLIGVNNQYRGRSADEYRREFDGLLSRAIHFVGGDPQRVIVVSIPDWGVTPFAKTRDRAKIAKEIDEYNNVNREESRKAGTRYANITPISRANPTMLTADGLHPSGEAYELWTVEILKVAPRGVH